jgi:Nif-specific regulatory protein
MTSTHPERWRDIEVFFVREVAKLLGRSLDPAVVVREILHLTSELLGLNRGRLLLYDERRDELSVRWAYGLTAAEMARGRFKPGEGVTGRVFTTGETGIVQDVDDDPAYLARTVDRKVLPSETVSFLALPVEREGRIVGVLAAHRLRGRRRAIADDVEMLRFAAVLIGQVLQIHEAVASRTARLEDENRDLREALERTRANHGVLGESPAIRACLAQVQRIADAPATVLLLGESGTGKELFARALHVASARGDGPFVKINCAALPETLVEAELFGYEKGAFTGAAGAHPGRFEQADGGTLFLDEVGELPLGVQAKLLRALQDRVVVRLGGKRDIAVQVRVVAATNRDLGAAVAGGQFRADLYYRLNVLPLALPPLRSRGGDVAILARHFFKQACLAYRRRIEPDDSAIDALSRFAWPGNIRQLHNVIERLVLLSDGPAVAAREVAAVLEGEGGLGEATAGAAAPGMPAIAAASVPGSGVDAGVIAQAILAARGNKSRAAQNLGLTLRQLDYRMGKLGMPRR